jgi:type IV pilus assembly protein PilF
MRILLVLIAALMLAGCASPYKAGSSEDQLTRSQRSAKIHTELANLYYERNQLGVALEEVRQALAAEPAYAPAFSARGLVHMALHENKEAEEDFRHSISLDDSNSESHNNYGWFLCNSGREQESVKEFLTALKNPLYATPERAYLNAGLCSQKAGNAKDAETYLQRALLLMPDMPEARLGMARLDFAKGDYTAAKLNFDRYAHAAPDSLTAETLWMAIRMERRLGDKAAEESYALQLSRRFPDSNETRMMTQGQ